MRRLISFAIHRPKSVLAGWLMLVALAAPFALQLGGALKAGGFSDPRGEATLAQETLEQAFGDAPNSLLIVLHDPAGAVTGEVPAARATAERYAEVVAVVDHRTEPAWLSSDGHTTFLRVDFGTDNTTVQNLVPDLEGAVRQATADHVDVQVTGAPALDYALNTQTKKDVTRAEMIAFPVLFVVLLLVFRSVASMLVPLVIAGVTLALAQAVGYGIAQMTDLNSLFTSVSSMIGLAVAVDYSLFIVKRFREELAAGRDVREAVERSMATAGHAVWFSGLAVIVALSALFIPRAMSFTSIALGGVTVTVVAVVLTMTLLPAVLRLLGHRINWGRLPGRLRGRVEPAAPAPATATRFVRRPGLVLAVLTVGFVALALPATQLNPQVPVASADILPADDNARVGIERIQSEIGLQDLFPVQVVLSADADRSAELLASVQAVTDRVAEATPVAEVMAVTTLGLPADQLPQLAGGGSVDLPEEARAAVDRLWTQAGDTVVARVLATVAADPDSQEAHRLVEDLRTELGAVVSSGVTVRVAGATATGVDFDNLVLRSVPQVVGWVALLSLLILVVAFRSLLLPLLALAFNAAVVSASLGFLALVSGAERTINSVTPLMLFAVMFGLSMDYMVIMISRMREMYLGRAGHREAVLGGLARTAGMINGAAAIMVAVFLSFTSAEISIVRELGICLAVAVILDAVIVRRLVMPSVLLLIGERVWGRRHSRRASASPSSAHVPQPVS
ncbi:MAG TPA: MMPL family transporter [Natronosporangium sp.]|nr:MMPL family transporter [Natronosporangium sp.]